MNSHNSTATIVTMGEDEDNNNKSRFGCFGGNRYIILVLSLLFLSANMSALIAYNATYVSLANIETSPLYQEFLDSPENVTVNDIDWNSADLSLSERRFAFTTAQKSLGFAGAFLGSIFAVVPMAEITRRVGCHLVMTVTGTIATILVLVTPIVISWSFPVFIVIRVLQGVTFANMFTVAGTVVNSWGTTAEKGLFIAVLSSHIELGAVFTMPISGALASSAGWPWVFYLHGIVLAFFTFLWAIYYRDRANGHPFVGDSEWKKISNGKQQSAKPAKAPIKKIMSSVVIWSVWIAVIGNFLVSQFSISYAPIYLKGVIGSSPTEAGLLTLIPMSCLLVIKFCTGFFSDRIKFISEINKIKIFNTLALLGSSIFFIILSCSTPGHSKAVDVVLLSIPMALLGFSSGGFSKCAVTVAGQFSPFVMSIVQIIAMTALMGGSFLVPALTPNDSFDEWRTVFVIYGAVLSLTNSIFIVFARAEPAKWAVQARDAAMMRTVMGREETEDQSNPAFVPDTRDSTIKTEIDSETGDIVVTVINRIPDPDSKPGPSTPPSRLRVCPSNLSAQLHAVLDETSHQSDQSNTQRF